MEPVTSSPLPGVRSSGRPARVCAVRLWAPPPVSPTPGRGQLGLPGAELRGTGAEPRRLLLMTSGRSQQGPPRAGQLCGKAAREGAGLMDGEGPVGARAYQSGNKKRVPGRGPAAVDCAVAMATGIAEPRG